MFGDDVWGGFLSIDCIYVKHHTLKSWASGLTVIRSRAAGSSRWRTARARGVSKHVAATDVCGRLLANENLGGLWFKKTSLLVLQFRFSLSFFHVFQFAHTMHGPTVPMVDIWTPLNDRTESWIFCFHQIVCTSAEKQHKAQNVKSMPGFCKM